MLEKRLSTETNVTFTRRPQEKRTMFFSFLDSSLSAKITNITLHHLQIGKKTGMWKHAEKIRMPERDKKSLEAVRSVMEAGTPTC